MAINRATALYLIDNTKPLACATTIKRKFKIHHSVRLSVQFGNLEREEYIQAANLTAADKKKHLITGKVSLKYKLTSTGKAMLKKEKDLVLSLKEIQVERGATAEGTRPYKKRGSTPRMDAIEAAAVDQFTTVIQKGQQANALLKQIYNMIGAHLNLNQGESEDEQHEE